MKAQMVQRLLGALAVAAGLLVTMTPPAAAATFDVSGTVLDADGAPVVGATVEAFTAGSAVAAATTVTSASGAYQLLLNEEPCAGGTFAQGVCTIVVPATQGPSTCPVPPAENPSTTGCYREFARNPVVNNCIAPYQPVFFTECKVPHDLSGKTPAEILSFVCPPVPGGVVVSTTTTVGSFGTFIEACFYPLVTTGGDCPAGTMDTGSACLQEVNEVLGAAECPPGFDLAGPDSCVSFSPANGISVEIRVTLAGSSSAAASATVVITGDETVDFALPAEPTDPDPDPGEFEQVAGDPIVLDLPATYFMDLEPAIQGVIAGNPLQCPTFSRGSGEPASGYMDLLVPSFTALWINRAFDVTVTLEGPIAGTSSVAGATFTSHDVFTGSLPASNTITVNLDPATPPGTDPVVSQFVAWGGDYDVTFSGYTITGRRYETTCPVAITLGS